MWYRVLVDDAAVGSVHLPPQRLAAGRMRCERGFDRVAPRLRAASRVLLAHGVYGPPISGHGDSRRRRVRLALAAAASLRVELAIEPAEERASTRFVNLIESPVDGGVIVVALFDEAPASIAASVALHPLSDPYSASEP